MIIQIIILIIGFIVLIKGADVFVDGASSIAYHLKLSKMFVGLTIIAFGTSAPEFAVSVTAITSGNGDMVLGNVIGSNILNILLILGIAGLIAPLKVKSNTVRKELPIMILMSVLVVVLFLDHTFDSSLVNAIGRADGIVILLFFLLFIYYLVNMMRNKSDEDGESFAKFKTGPAIFFTILGIGAIILGSNLVVDSASEIASTMGISQRMISLTVIALGTSLPELVTSIVSARKKEQDLIIGNVIGSNLFNLGIVLALPVALFGGIVPVGFTYLDLIMLVASAVLLYFFARKDHVISKIEAGILFVLFIVYYACIIIM